MSWPSEWRIMHFGWVKIFFLIQFIWVNPRTHHTNSTNSLLHHDEEFLSIIIRATMQPRYWSDRLNKSNDLECDGEGTGRGRDSMINPHRNQLLFAYFDLILNIPTQFMGNSPVRLPVLFRTYHSFPSICQTGASEYGPLTLVSVIDCYFSSCRSRYQTG